MKGWAFTVECPSCDDGETRLVAQHGGQRSRQAELTCTCGAGWTVKVSLLPRHASVNAMSA